MKSIGFWMVRGCPGPPRRRARKPYKTCRFFRFLHIRGVKKHAKPYKTCCFFGNLVISGFRTPLPIEFRPSKFQFDLEISISISNFVHFDIGILRSTLEIPIATIEFRPGILIIIEMVEFRWSNPEVEIQFRYRISTPQNPFRPRSFVGGGVSN